MSIVTWSYESRTPAGCYVADQLSYNQRVTDIAPRWGAPGGTTRFYKHSTPGGVAPPTALVELLARGPNPTLPLERSSPFGTLIGLHYHPHKVRLKPTLNANRFSGASNAPFGNRFCAFGFHAKINLRGMFRTGIGKRSSPPSDAR
jgi:hypothetical protein